MRDRRWPLGALLAEFEQAGEVEGAVAVLREAGYREFEFYSPYPMEEPIEQAGYSKSRLPLTVLIAGIAGGLASYLIQWWTNAIDYPLNIGGRPAHAVPAFVVPTFEGTVLLAALGGFFGLLFRPAASATLASGI